MTYTFRGGVRVAEHKNTARCAVTALPAPARVAISLAQYAGAPAVATVAKGDKVAMGQVIGKSEDGLGCPVHASVSGTVVDVTEQSTPTGGRAGVVVIENDGLDTVDASIRGADKPLSAFTPDEIVEIVRAAGITAMDGSAAPAYALLRAACGRVDRLFVNCAESEPFLTATHRLMLEHPEQIVNGAKILLRAFGLRLAEIAVEDNATDGANALAAAVKQSELIRIRMLRAKYPQGDARLLVNAVTGRAVPPGGTPVDVGCAVFSAATCAAVYRAFATGMPLVERVVTVDGDGVAAPKNLSVRIGTPASALLAACASVGEPQKLIFGGPICGVAVADRDTPISKDCCGVLAFADTKNAASDEAPACMRCGRCVAVCPARLLPSVLCDFARKGKNDAAERFGILGCLECGSCSYVCPARVPVAAQICRAKSQINEKRRADATEK